MIRVNDKWDVQFRSNMTVHDLLRACDFTHRHLVVSVNGALVQPEEFDAYNLADGDQVRVVHVIGGG